MKSNETMNKVINAILPCLNNKDMKITEDAVQNIVIDCKVAEPFATAIQHVADWFNNAEVNERSVAEMCDIDQNRYVGTMTAIMTLLAEGDVTALLDNWVLNGLED